MAETAASRGARQAVCLRGAAENYPRLRPVPAQKPRCNTFTMFDNASESLKCLKSFAAIGPRFRRMSRRRPRVSMFSRFFSERGRDGPGSDGSIGPCGPASNRRQCCRRTRIRGQGPAPRPATKRAAHPAPCDPTRPRNRQLSGFAPSRTAANRSRPPISPNSTGRNRDRRNLDRPHISTDELV